MSCRHCRYAALYHHAGADQHLGCYHPQVLADETKGQDPRHSWNAKINWLIARIGMCGKNARLFEARA